MAADRARPARAGPGAGRGNAARRLRPADLLRARPGRPPARSRSRPFARLLRGRLRPRGDSGRSAAPAPADPRRLRRPGRTRGAAPHRRARRCPQPPSQRTRSPRRRLDDLSRRAGRLASVPIARRETAPEDPRTMISKLPALGALALAPLCWTSGAAAHGIVGDRFFPATLITDDPAVADELSLPTIDTFKTGD